MRRKCDIDIIFKTMRKYLSTLLVASVLAASCTKDAEVIREKIVNQSRPILSGQGQPENTKGEDGDYYLDLANADLYGPKTKGVWGTPALNLKGAAGKDGKDGANGTNGATPRIGDNGNWWVGDQDTGKPARGEQGERGIPGANGRDGNNGFTPYIGNNGNWWVDNRDTGRPARGENGAPGRNGQNGTDGSKILAEDRAPQATDGVKGDYFIDKAAKIFYGPKTDAGWPTTGISLVANQVMITDYELSEDGKTLVKWNNKQTRVIDMNADPKLKNVTKIANNAFQKEDNGESYQLTTIIVGDRVTEIGNSAFRHCARLRTVDLPEGITRIENGTFDGCVRLQTIEIPEAVTSIGVGAFSSCMKLYTMILPERVNSLGNAAFSNCASLHSVIIRNKTAFAIDNSVFTQTPIQNIYVFSEKVDDYKNVVAGPYKNKVKALDFPGDN